MAQLFDFVGFHEEFAVALGVGSQEGIDGRAVSYVENVSIVTKLQPDYVFRVFFDYLGRFEFFK